MRLRLGDGEADGYSRDPDVKRRKQAEFLVHGKFPLHLIERIAVIDETMMQEVIKLLKEGGCTARVTIERKWYYD
jgi:hypothetical protein